MKAVKRATVNSIWGCLKYSWSIVLKSIVTFDTGIHEHGCSWYGAWILHTYSTTLWFSYRSPHICICSGLCWKSTGQCLGIVNVLVCFCIALEAVIRGVDEVSPCGVFDFHFFTWLLCYDVSSRYICSGLCLKIDRTMLRHLDFLGLFLHCFRSSYQGCRRSIPMWRLRFPFLHLVVVLRCFF